MESALRTAYKMITGQNMKNLDLTEVRSDGTGFRITEITIQDKKVRVAVVAGTQNIDKLLDALKTNPHIYDYVEVMVCPYGCISGGGTPLLPLREEEWGPLMAERRKVLYDLDKSKQKRTAHDNPMVKEYIDWVEAKHDAHFVHDVFHTNFD